jgi:putative tributyrin esterase
MASTNYSIFHTVEISDPAYDVDNLRYVTVKSPALGRRADASVFLPNTEIDEDTPIVILLHGAYSSHWAWTHKAGVHLTATEMIENETICPMIIVMPSDGLWGDCSAYLKHADADYERWIVEEVPYVVREAAPEIGAGGPVFIAGLSLGGYGAMRIGAKYAEWFSGISAHSAVTDFTQLPQNIEEPIVLYGDIDFNDANVLYWMKKNGENLPPVRFDCGTSDALLENNRFLHKELENANIEHEYTEFDGGHDWGYWQKHIRETLVFFSDIMDDSGDDDS